MVKVHIKPKMALLIGNPREFVSKCMAINVNPIHSRGLHFNQT